MSWFSTKVRIVCLIEHVGAVRFMDSIHVFQAHEYSDAMEVALSLSRSHESSHTNSDGDRVVWKFMEVIILDQLDDELDRAEVYSEQLPFPPGTAIAFDAEFHPDESSPVESV